MPRLNVVDPASATGRAKELFDGPLKGKHLNIFKGMANAPAVLDAYLAFNGAMAKAGLSAKEQEVIQLTVGQANGCGYCVAAHTVIGKGAGLTEDQTVEARRGHLADAKLDALSKFGAALVEKKGWVSDDDLAAIRKAGYNDAHITEAVAVYALATLTNTFNHVNGTEIDFPTPPEA